MCHLTSYHIIGTLCQSLCLDLDPGQDLVRGLTEEGHDHVTVTEEADPAGTRGHLM